MKRLWLGGIAALAIAGLSGLAAAEEASLIVKGSAAVAALGTFEATGKADLRGPTTHSHPSPILVQSCIAQGQICTLNGTPCCAPHRCGGRFPNTTCQ